MPAAELSQTLIRLLLMLARTGSLRAAAEALRISPPAASYALAHARTLLGDPLFMRTNTGMAPTLRMAELLPELEALSAGMDRVLSRGTKIFNPASSAMCFRIACFDNFFPLMLGPAVKRLREAALGLKLELVPQAEGVIEDMRRGQIDFCLRANAEMPADFRFMTAAESSFAVLADKAHPLAAEAAELAGADEAENGRCRERSQRFRRLRKADLAPYAQVQIRVPVERAEAGAVTRPLSFEKDADARNVFVSTQSFLGAPLLLPGTDLLLVLPKPTAAYWAAFSPKLAMFEVEEFEQTPFRARFFWHERVDASPQHQWLRGVFTQALQALQDHWAPASELAEGGHASGAPEA